MRNALHARFRFRPSLALVLLFLFAAVLWVAGGASRADAQGQAVVRAVSIAVLMALAIFGQRPAIGRARPVAYVLGAAILLAGLQLIPLPPAMWQSLPGRATFLEAAELSGMPQPWRSWAIVPEGAVNALTSLVVPVVMLALVCSIRDVERSWLPGLALTLVGAAAATGLLQAAGVSLDNPFLNQTAGEVSGIFANRNHFALFLALGCVLAPAWAFSGGRRSQWRGLAALGLVLLFVLTILASGSRAGLIVGLLSLGLGFLMVRDEIGRMLSRHPRWVFPALVAMIVGLIVMLVLLSVLADRATSIDRLFASDQGQDMRRRGLPTVLAMIREYFPFGSGLGGFDPLFRLHEPFDLLKFTYFNHAHNDWLEIVLDTGLAGLLLSLAAIAWWAKASVRAWRAPPGSRDVLPKLGSVMLLLVMVASVFDYPARTPTIMAMIVMGAWWLARGTGRTRVPALPETGQHL